MTTLIPLPQLFIVTIVVLVLIINQFGYNSSSRVRAEYISPTCENVEVFITTNNYNSYVCNDFNRSWKSTTLNGTFSYSSSSNRKVLIYQGVIGSKINYRFATCASSSSTSTPNYSILLNDQSVMKNPYLNPSLYCNAKDACNLGVSKAAASDVSGLKYIYLKDYSNKMTLKRLTSEELLIQSMYLYLCYVPSTAAVIDLAIPSTPNSITIMSNQTGRNTSNVITMKNSGIDAIGSLSLTINIGSVLGINHLTLSIGKVVRVNHVTNILSTVTTPYTLTVVNSSNTATVAFTSLNLLANQSLQVTMGYKWKTESTLTTTNTTTSISYSTTTSTTGQYYDPMISPKVQNSFITLLYMRTSTTNNSTLNNFNNSTTTNSTSTTSNSTVTNPNANTNYSEFDKAVSFMVDNLKRVIVVTHKASSTSSCFVQTFLNFNSTFNGTVLITSSSTSNTLTIPQQAVNTTSFIIPPTMIKCQANAQTVLTLKIINTKTSTTNGTLTMMKKNVKSMAVDQSFVISKPLLHGEVNALTISSYSTRENTPQNIEFSTSVTSSQPYFLFIIQSGQMPSTLDYSQSFPITSGTPSYSFSLPFKQVPVGSLLLIVESECEKCSGLLSFGIPTLYSNPPVVELDGSISQKLSQSSTGLYPYYISYYPSDSNSYLLATVTIQNLSSITTAGKTTYIPPSLMLTATQASTLQRTTLAFSKTVTVNCQNENTNSVTISTWLQPTTSGVWKFNLQMNPSYSNSNSVVNYVLQSISSPQSTFSLTSSSASIQLPYYSPPTETVIQRILISSTSNNFQISILLDYQNLLLSKRKYKVYLKVGTPVTTTAYDLVLDFSSQYNYNVKIISYEGGMILESGTDRAFINTPFLKLSDKAVYVSVSPLNSEISTLQSCNSATQNTRATLSYTMVSTPTTSSIHSSSYLTKFSVKPGSVIDVDLSDTNVKKGEQLLIELFSLQYTAVPTPTLYGVIGSEIYSLPLTRNDYVYKQYQTSMKALKFISEISMDQVKQYSRIMLIFSSYDTFSEASFRGTAEGIDSKEMLYIEKYFFESYITAGCIIGILLLYSLTFLCVLCIQAIRKKKLNIDNEKEWESFIPAMITTLPMFMAISACKCCVKNKKDERESKYRVIFNCGILLLILAIAWLGGFGSVVGITIFETVGLMKYDSVDMILSQSAYACCVVQSGTYSETVYTDFEINNLGNTFKCINVISDNNPITEFYVNSKVPTTPIGSKNVEGTLSAVGWSNLQCKGSKVVYVPEKFELAKYLCIAGTFGLFILGGAMWFFIFLCIACIQSPKKRRHAIKAPSSSKSPAKVNSDGKPQITKQQPIDHQRDTMFEIPQYELPRHHSIHRSPTAATTKPTHTFADYEVFFPTKDSKSPLNKRRDEYEMYDIPIITSPPPPSYTPPLQSPTQFIQHPHRNASPYYTYEQQQPPNYRVIHTNNTANLPVQNGILPPPPPYSTVVLPPVQSNETYYYQDDFMDALNIPTPEAIKMTSQ